MHSRQVNPLFIIFFVDYRFWHNYQTTGNNVTTTAEVLNKKQGKRQGTNVLNSTYSLISFFHTATAHDELENCLQNVTRS